MEGVPADQYPAKVIEFIKRWVAKEKVLITHCVKQIIEQAVEMAAVGQQTVTSPSEKALVLDTEENLRGDEEKQRTANTNKDLVAKKNK